MKVPKPRQLAVVGPLAGDLEVQPLVAEVLFGGGGVADGLVLVVGFAEVLVDSAAFPKGEVMVGVGDGGDAAIRVDFRGEGGLFGLDLLVAAAVGKMSGMVTAGGGSTFFKSPIPIILVSYGIFSSSRMMALFQGFGP